MDDPPEPGSDERLPAPMFSEGGRPGPGRPKGGANRTTLVMRQAIATVFEDLQASHGGDGHYPHFLDWAQKNPTEFYRIAARQTPVQIEAGLAIGRVVFKGLNDHA